MTQSKQRRLRWFGHTVRRDPNNISKVKLKRAPSDGKRQRGRPKKSLKKLLTPSSKTLKRHGVLWRESLATEGPWYQPSAPPGGKRISKLVIVHVNSNLFKNHFLNLIYLSMS